MYHTCKLFSPFYASQQRRVTGKVVKLLCKKRKGREVAVGLGSCQGSKVWKYEMIIFHLLLCEYNYKWESKQRLQMTTWY